VFGWIVLAAVLFGGVGSLLYIALGERNANRVPDAAASAAGSSRTVENKTVGPERLGGSVTPAEAAGGGSGSAARDPASAGPPASAAHDTVRPPDAVSGSGGTKVDGAAADSPHKPDDRRKRPAHPATVRRGPVAAAPDEVKAPAAVLKQAKSFDASGDWDESRKTYQRLEKVKGYRSEALYRGAWAAFQSSDIAEAARLSLQGASEPGPFQTQAKFLYGDALYRQGEYKHAKEYYLTLRTKVRGDDRTTATKKIAACNKALNLPDGDGIRD
jgi:tetratricopeptide (TPR) repeat protein